MRKENFLFFLLNRRKLRVSESRSNVYIDYAEREQLHEGGARVIVESQNRGILRVSECRSNAVTELVEFCE